MVKTLLAGLWLTAMLDGCAAEVERTATGLEPPQAGQQERVLRVRDAVTVTLATGYSRSIAANSVWRYAGRTPQGEVYRPVDRVFTIEGANTHEAYLVMDNGWLVGFYLSGEAAFSPLPSAVRLNIE